MADLSVVYRIAADITGLKQGVDKAVASTQALEKMADNLASKLKTAFGVGAVIAAGKELVDYGGKLTDLSQKTGISTTALQKLELAFKQNGASVEDVAGAVTKLSVNLLNMSKTDPAAQALGKIGLSLDSLIKMKPEERFIKLADAIGRMQNPTEKAWLTMQMFGKGGAELLGTLDGHLEETTSKFEAMGLIIDEQVIAAADEFGDKLGLMGKQLLGIVATIVGPLLPAISAMAEALLKVAQVIGGLLGPLFSTLVKWLLEVGIAFDNFLIAILKAAKNIPILGRFLGVLDGAIEFLQKDADDAKAAITGMNAVTDKTAKVATAATGPLLGMGKATDDAAKAAKKLAEALEEARIKNSAFLKGQLADIIEEQNKKWLEQRALIQENTKAILDAEKRQSDIIAQYTLSELEFKKRAINEEAQARIEGLNKTADGYEEAKQQILDTAQTEVDSIQAIWEDGADKITHSMVDPFQKAKVQVSDIIGHWADVFHDLGSSIGDGFGETISSVGDVLSGVEQTTAAMEEFGKAGQSAMGKVSALAQGVAGLMKATSTKSKSMNVAGGAMAGAQIGTAILPGWGTAIGAGVGALVGWLRSGKAEKEMNKTRQAFIDAAGGLATLDQKAAKAGMTLKHLLDARDPEAYKKAIEELNDAFQFQEDSMKTLEETVSKYGFSIEELGPALQRQQLDKQAQELFKDWKVLNAAGIDTTAITTRMADKINEFFQASIKAGTEIPIAMKPMLQQMVDQGLLLDANGNKITNLEEAGVSFSMTMSEGFKSLIDEVKKLTDAIARGLGLAIENVPDVEVGVNYHTGTVEPPPELPSLPGPVNPGDVQTTNPFAAMGGLVTSRGVQHFDLGGLVQPRGTDTVAAMLTPGEMVLTPRQQQTMMAPNIRVDLTVNTIDAQSFRELMRNEGSRAVVEGLEDKLAGLYTRWRDALGIA